MVAVKCNFRNIDEKLESLYQKNQKGAKIGCTVKPRIWNTDRSAAKVFHMRDLFHMRGSIFGVIYLINAIFMQ